MKKTGNAFAFWLAMVMVLSIGCNTNIGQQKKADPTKTATIPATNTPTPTTTPTPTLTPTPGPLVIDDDFSTDAGRFQCESCVVQNGALTVGPFPMVNSLKPFFVLCGDCGAFANYRMSVDTSYNSGNSNRGFGLVVREGDQSVHLVAVSPWQLYNVFEFDSSMGGGLGYTSLINGWVFVVDLASGRAVHHIDILMQNGSMTLTLNGTFSSTIDLPTGTGEVGLWVGGWETSAIFDNFHFEEIR